MTKTISVSAQKPWVDTAVDLKAGDELIIRASGQWTNGGDPAYYAGPEGFAGVMYEKATLKSANFIALIGKVGDTGEPFLVGSAYQKPSPGTGRLYLQINDENNDFAFADNDGEMKVEVTSQSPESLIEHKLSWGGADLGGITAWHGDLEGTGGNDISHTPNADGALLVVTPPGRLAYMEYYDPTPSNYDLDSFPFDRTKFDSISLKTLMAQQFNDTSLQIRGKKGWEIIAVRTRHGHYSKLFVRWVYHRRPLRLVVHWTTYAGP